MVYFTFIPTTRLGNWLFQYAAAMALSDDAAGYMPDPRMREMLEPYRDIFGKLEISDVLPPGIRVHADKASGTYEPIPHDGEDLCLKGYFQSEKYFKGSAAKVREAFAMTPERRGYLQAKYGEWLSRPNVTGLSVRRGDYLKLPYRYPLMNRGYFRRCFEKLSKCNDFIVCSDDISWCKIWLPKWFPGKRFCFVEGESVLDQLYIHSLCQNNIISNSSFSWWGAWLNENPSKRVLLPRTWFGAEARHYGNYGLDIAAEGWERVPNYQMPLEWLQGQVMAWWRIFKRTFYPVKRFITVNILGGTH